MKPHLPLLITLTLLLTACRTATPITTSSRTLTADTTHRATLTADTVRVTDSLTIVEIRRADTVHLTERHVIHRDRILRHTDTVQHVRLDTVLVMQEIAPAHPPEDSTPTFPLWAVALGILACIAYLLPSFIKK